MPANDFLTVKERLLLHLHGFRPDTSDYVLFPKELTRSGIASAIFVDPRYLARATKFFLKKGFLVEELRSTEGGTRKQKVCYLTEEGHDEGEKILEKCLGIPVVLKRKNGREQHTTLAEVGAITGTDVPLLQMMELVDEEKSLEERVLEEALARSEDRFVSHIDTMQHPRYFFGRKKELADFERILDETPVVVLTGIAGIGKTTLCAKFMEHMKNMHNSFWFDFHEWTTIYGLLDSLSRFFADIGHKNLKAALQKNENPSLEVLEKILKNAIPDSNTFFVFDDFQFANRGVVEFFKLFVLTSGQMKGARMIISCRALPDLPFYDRRDATVRNIVKEYDLQGLDMEGCREMLEHRGIEVSEEKLRAFWTRLGGHPFFFEVINSATDISSIIDNERDISRFLDDEIYAHLSETERNVLGMISVFRGPVPGHLVKNATGCTEDTISNLVKRSLLVEESGGSYDTHVLLKEFFYGKPGRAQRIRFHGVAADYYQNSGEESSLTELPYHLIKARRFDEALHNVSTNVEDLIDRGKIDEFENIVSELDREDLGMSWSSIGLLKGALETARGNHDRARGILMELLSRKSEMEPGTVARIYKNLGDLEKLRVKWKEALSNYERAMSISLTIQDDRGLAEAYEGMGGVAFRNGDHEKAIDYNSRCLDAAEHLGDLALQTTASIDIGLSYYYTGQTDSAIEFFLKSLDLLDMKPNNYHKARVLNNLGASYFMKDRYDKALEMWERCLQISRANGFSDFEGLAYMNAADIYSRKEDWEKARTYLTRGEEIFRKMDHRVELGYVILTWAIYYKRRKEWDASEKYFEKAIAMARENKTPDNLAENYLEMGFMYRDRGDWDKARERFEEALNIYEQQKSDALIAKVKGELVALDEQENRT